jgi:hypothetical protein
MEQRRDIIALKCHLDLTDSEVSQIEGGWGSDPWQRQIDHLVC